MSIRVLLVDDHELVREGLRAILEKDESVEVVGETSGGREAVALSRTLSPDVVVMDVGMNDLNGIDATRQIRTEFPKIHVVALSSHSDSRYVRAMLDAGACAYVLKANAYVDLHTALHKARQGKSFLCADVTKGVVDASPTIRRPKDRSCVEREREVLQLLAEGLTSPRIGKRLFIATSTVETHRRSIMRKLAIHSVADLTKWAIREGLTQLEAEWCDCITGHGCHCWICPTESSPSIPIRIDVVDMVVGAAFQSRDAAFSAELPGSRIGNIRVGDHKRER
jgi:two-component system NarL family response regulator